MLFPPVPETAAVCGLPMASSVTENSAIRFPMATGLNVIVTTQEEPCARLAPQVFAVMEKSPGSVPVKPMPENVTVPVPPLVSVNVLGTAATPTDCDPHDRLAGLMLRVAVAVASPVPNRETVCGLLDAPSSMLNVAVRIPVPLGENVR